MKTSIHFPSIQLGETSLDELTIEVPTTLRRAVDYFEEIRETLPEFSNVRSAYFTFDRTYQIFEDADDAEASVRSKGYSTDEFIIRTLLPE